MSDKDKEHINVDELVTLKKRTTRSIIIGVLILLVGVLSLVIGTIKDNNVFILYGGILFFISGWIFYKYSSD